MLRSLIAVLMFHTCALAIVFCTGMLVIPAANESLSAVGCWSIFLAMTGVIALLVPLAMYLYPSRNKLWDCALAIYQVVEQRNESPVPSTRDDAPQGVLVGYTADGKAVITLTRRRGMAKRRYFIDVKSFRIERRVEGYMRPSDYLWRHLPLTKDWLEYLLRLTKRYGARYSPERDEGWFFEKADYTLGC